MAYRFPSYNPHMAPQQHGFASPWNNQQSPYPFANGQFQQNYYHSSEQTSNYRQGALPQHASYPQRGRGGGRSRGRRQNNFHQTSRGPIMGNCHDEASSVTNGEFECKPCEKSFNAQHDFNAHLKTHIECHFEGCDFVAAKKIVTLHFIKCHEEGKFKICLDTPEDIAKWREQRKRSFPTKENIAKKVALQEQRQQNGINLKTKSFKYQNRQCIRCNGRPSKRGRGRERGRGRGRPGQDDSGCSCWRNGLSGEAYQQLVKSDEVTPTDTCLSSSGTNDKTEKVKKASSKRDGGLGLLAAYSSDEESSDDHVEAVSESTVAQTAPVEVKATEGATTHHQLNGTKRKQQHQHQENSKRKRNSKRNKRRNQAQTSTRHGNLLEMLLAKDIRAERNAILQCVRYIVKQNFFKEMIGAVSSP